MTDEEKKELFKHSETLKKQALELFGQQPQRGVFGLLLAASNLLKINNISYNECLMSALNILLHLENCQGCEDHKEQNNKNGID